MDLTEIELSAERGNPTRIAGELLSVAGFSEGTIDCYEVLDGGNPVMSQVFRVYLSGDSDSPKTAIVKVPARDSADRRREAATGSYAREIEVYDLLKDMQGEFQPSIYSSMYDSESKTAALLIEDLGSMPHRSDFDIEMVHRVLANLAEIHRRFWCDEGLGRAWWIRESRHADIFNEEPSRFASNWQILKSTPGLHPCDEPEVNRVGEYLSYELPTVLYHLDRRPPTLTHGDLHTANMMLRRDGLCINPVLIDWQDAVYGGASSDVAKFLSTTLGADVAKSDFHELIASYHRCLDSRIQSSYPYAVFRRDVMLSLLGTFANYVIAADTRCESSPSASAVNSSLRRVSAVINVVKPIDWL